MRPIDADALTKDLTCDFTGNPLHGNMKTSMGNIRAMISAQPTIDAVPVVRCGECRHADDSLILWCSEHEKAVSRLDFCSYGKRKEADHEVSK